MNDRDLLKLIEAGELPKHDPRWPDVLSNKLAVATYGTTGVAYNLLDYITMGGGEPGLIDIPTTRGEPTVVPWAKDHLADSIVVRHMTLAVTGKNKPWLVYADSVEGQGMYLTQQPGNVAAPLVALLPPGPAVLIGDPWLLMNDFAFGKAIMADRRHYLTYSRVQYFYDPMPYATLAMPDRNEGCITYHVDSRGNMVHIK